MPDPGEVDEDAKVEQLRMELSLLLVKLGTSVQDAEKMQAELAETAMKDSIVPTLANSPFGISPPDYSFAYAFNRCKRDC